MWSEQFTNMLFLMVMASLLRASYELSRQRSSGVELGTHKAPVGGSNPSAATEETELMPWQKEASEKAVQKYAEAQAKKWRNWNEAMFKRSA